MDMTARRFSEAMWFKRGDGDALAEGDGEDSEVTTLDQVAPIAERYHDDGSLSPDDLARYNLRTGRTEPVSAIRDAPGGAVVARPASRARQLFLALAATGVIVAIGVVARILG
jgi:hypothetical protein